MPEILSTHISSHWIDFPSSLPWFIANPICPFPWMHHNTAPYCRFCFFVVRVFDWKSHHHHHLGLFFGRLYFLYLSSKFYHWNLKFRIWLKFVFQICYRSLSCRLTVSMFRNSSAIFYFLLLSYGNRPPTQPTDLFKSSTFFMRMYCS